MISYSEWLQKQQLSEMGFSGTSMGFLNGTTYVPGKASPSKPHKSKVGNKNKPKKTAGNNKPKKPKKPKKSKVAGKSQ